MSSFSTSGGITIKRIAPFGRDPFGEGFTKTKTSAAKLPFFMACFCLNASIRQSGP